MASLHATASSAPATPTPRDGLDSGSLADLLADCDGVFLDVHAARPWPHDASGHVAVAVPDDASALLEGLGLYGS